MMVLDTGCEANIISLPIWTLMEAQGVMAINKHTVADKKFYAFGQKEPIPVLLVFEAKTEPQGKSKMAKLYVLDVKDKCLLGEERARDMNLITTNVSR